MTKSFARAPWKPAGSGAIGVKVSGIFIDLAPGPVPIIGRGCRLEGRIRIPHWRRAMDLVDESTSRGSRAVGKPEIAGEFDDRPAWIDGNAVDRRRPRWRDESSRPGDPREDCRGVASGARGLDSAAEVRMTAVPTYSSRLRGRKD